MAFPADLPLDNPYNFYFTWFIWLPMVVRIIVLPYFLWRVGKAHGQKLSWIVKLIWELPGGKKMALAIGYGMILPPFLAFFVKIIGHFGWNSWSEVPGWAAALFLLFLVGFWIWDGSRIWSTVVTLRTIEASKTKIKLAKGAISTVQGVAHFLQGQADVDEESGKLTKGKAFLAKGLLKVGKKGVDKVVDKVEEKVEKAQVSMLISGFFFQMAPLILLLTLFLIDFYL